MVLIGTKWLYSGKSCCIRANWLYSGNVVVFGHGGCIWAKVIVLGQIWLYLGKYGCIRAKVVVFGKKWLYSGKCLYSAKVVIFGQSGCLFGQKLVFIYIFKKVVVFVQKQLSLRKNGCIGAKEVVFVKICCIRAI